MGSICECVKGWGRTLMELLALSTLDYPYIQ